MFAGGCLAAQSSAGAADSSAEGGAASVLARVQPLAEQGDAKAQYNMGVIYDRGYGVERDYAQARSWYEKAAAQGDAEAAHNLGVMYHQGHGVAVDDKQAVDWFREAAKLGEPAAQNNLAVMYAEGMGVEQDLAQAVAWMARAAVAGNDSATNNLPVLAAELPGTEITGNAVNVRAKPTTAAEVLAQADAGTAVALLKTQDEWSRVLLPDHVVGWISNGLLAAAVPATTGADADVTDTADVVETGVVSRDDATAPLAVAAAGDDGDDAGAGADTAAVTAVAAGQTDAHAVVQKDTRKDTQGQSEPAVTPATNAAGGLAAGGPDPTVAADTPAPDVAGGKDAVTAGADDEASAAQTQPQEAAQASAVAAQATVSTKTVGVGTANVREQPSRQATVLFRLQRGDRVAIVKSHSGWAYVEAADGQRGWVAGYLLVGG